ncbi:MAG TPA: Glu/Leu/Phe/Val dehydrogenase [Bacteroidia bacterium]|jgi:leucine dehydrogenase
MEVKDKAASLAENPVIAQMGVYDHEQLVFCNDNATGLKAIIGIHNTVLGPSLGGTRMWKYNNEMEAIRDVLRLSRGMTYKASVAGLNLGGGKAVIIGDSKKDKNEKFMRRFGQFVNSLGGKYITAEDVGIGTDDMVWVSKETKHVTGLPGKSGDPSPVTAFGVYHAMKASAKEKWGDDSLAGKKVMVQGIGHVGENLVKYITKEGAKVFISDISEERLAAVSKEYKAEVVDKDKVYDVDMDIYAPCALGATVNTETLDRLKCGVICGAANNQLADEKVHGEEVRKRGIIYAPDFVVNAGGLISVSSEISGISMEEVMRLAQGIYDTTLRIFSIAREKNIPTYQAANRIAEERIENKKKKG